MHGNHVLQVPRRRARGARLLKRYQMYYLWERGTRLSSLPSLIRGEAESYVRMDYNVKGGSDSNSAGGEDGTRKEEQCVGSTNSAERVKPEGKERADEEDPKPSTSGEEGSNTPQTRASGASSTKQKEQGPGGTSSARGGSKETSPNREEAAESLEND